MEKEWLKVLKGGGEVKNIRMKIDYDEENLRPIGFAIEFISQGEKQVRYIDNI